MAADFIAEFVDFDGKIEWHGKPPRQEALTIAAAGSDAQLAHAAQRVRNQAQEPQRTGAGVAELVELIGRHIDGGSGTHNVFVVAFDGQSGAFEDKQFMFVGVGMFGGMATGRDLEESHGKARRGVVRSDQAAHAAIDGALGSDGLGFNLLAMDDFHGKSSPPVRILT
jgi:hypothetical protein